MTKLVCVLFALLLWFGCGGLAGNRGNGSLFSTATVGSQTGLSIPATFFGMHGHDRGGPDYMPTNLTFGTFRTVDSPVSWPLIEVSRGVFDWSKSDLLISQAVARNIDVIMNLFRTPTWASSNPTQDSAYAKNCAVQLTVGCGNAAPPENLADWDSFVETFATRYVGQVRYYEIWNEPDLPSTWTGTVPQMVELAAHAYRIIKSIDPTAKIICPSISNPGASSWLKSYFEAGGVPFTDIVGFHGYGFQSSPEQSSAAVINLKQLNARHDLAKAELWDTEGSWGTNAPPDWPERARWIVAFHLLQAAAGADRVIWYAYNNDSWGTLTLNPLSPGPYELNQAGVAYDVLAKWLIGSTVKTCGKLDPGIWSCEISANNGYLARVVWSDEGTLPLKPEVTVGSGFTQARDVLNDIPAPITSSLTAGTVPILLENGAIRR